MAHYPPQFQETLTALKAHNRDRASQFARARARFRLAQSLTGIGLHGMSAPLEAGYTELRKLSRAYSAHEMLTTSPKKFPPPIFGEECLQRFTSPEMRVFREAVTLYTTNPRLTPVLFALAGGCNANIVVLLAAVRHMTLHGEFSVYGAGLHRATTRTFFEDFTSWLFNHLDKTFLEFPSSRTREVQRW